MGVDSGPAKAAAGVLRAPKGILEQSPFAGVLPQPLKTAIIDRPAEFPELLESILAQSDEDERMLTTATEFRDALSSRIGNDDQANDGKVERISSPNTSAFDAET